MEQTHTLEMFVLLWSSSWSSLEFCFKTMNFVVMHSDLTGPKGFNAIICCQEVTLEAFSEFTKFINSLSSFFPSWMNLKNMYKDEYVE